MHVQFGMCILSISQKNLCACFSNLKRGIADFVSVGKSQGPPQEDLSQYSTTIDVAKLPAQQRKKAERLAKEIELRQCCRGWEWFGAAWGTSKKKRFSTVIAVGLEFDQANFWGGEGFQQHMCGQAMWACPTFTVEWTLCAHPIGLTIRSCFRDHSTYRGMTEPHQI